MGGVSFSWARPWQCGQSPRWDRLAIALPKARSTVRFQLPRAKSLSRLVAAASARSVAATSSTPSILSRSGSGEVPGRVADSSAVWKERGEGGGGLVSRVGGSRPRARKLTSSRLPQVLLGQPVRSRGRGPARDHRQGPCPREVAGKKRRGSHLSSPARALHAT